MDLKPNIFTWHVKIQLSRFPCLRSFTTFVVADCNCIECWSVKVLSWTSYFSHVWFFVQNVIRVCRIRSFCHSLVGVEGSEMAYEKSSKKFEGPEEPQEEDSEHLDIQVSAAETSDFLSYRTFDLLPNLSLVIQTLPVSVQVSAL